MIYIHGMLKNICVGTYQLQDTGLAIEDFDEGAQVSLAKASIYHDMDTFTWKIPSGKLEALSEKLIKAGLESLPPYKDPTSDVESDGEKRFRIIFGRCTLYTQGHTVNNPILHEMMPTNTVWIHKDVAEEMGIRHGDPVEVSGSGYSAVTGANLTDIIHRDSIELYDDAGKMGMRPGDFC